MLKNAPRPDRTYRTQSVKSKKHVLKASAGKFKIQSPPKRRSKGKGYETGNTIGSSSASPRIAQSPRSSDPCLREARAHVENNDVGARYLRFRASHAANTKFSERRVRSAYARMQACGRPLSPPFPLHALCTRALPSGSSGFFRPASRTC